jgi:hypothetical protein
MADINTAKSKIEVPEEAPKKTPKPSGISKFIE